MCRYSAVDILRARKDLLYGERATEALIAESEKKLGLRFSESYKEYLMEYGIAAFAGHELTGLSNAKRTNVVDVTVKEKTRNKNITDELYVIEETNMDGMVFWQNQKGEVYKSFSLGEITKVYDSFEEYLSAFISHCD